MATMLLHTFAGEVPRTTPRLLEQAQAAVAVNCDLARGALEPLRGPALEQPLAAPARTIFKHAVDGWLTWDGDVTVLKSAVLDATQDTPLGHIFVCGAQPWPTQYLAGGEVCRLGIPRPGVAPTVTLQGQAAAVYTTRVYGFGGTTGADALVRYGVTQVPNVEGDGVTLQASAMNNADIAGLEDTGSTVQRSTAYCYTYVRSLAGGIIQQESAPSPPSPVLDVHHGDGVKVSGFAIPEGMRITHIRLYRTVSGTTSADFRFLAELPANTREHLDTMHDKDVPTEVLRTSLWDAIPDDAKGLMKTDNGIYAAFRGNELLISVPFFAYAFPAAYRLTVEDRIVALAHVDNTIMVLTTGRPYLVAGSVPDSLQLSHLPIEQACVSAASVATLPGGVLYASPDGLMLFSTGEQTLATAQTFTREQWQALRPETLMGTVHDGRYVGFFAGSNTGFLFNVGARDVVRVELPQGWHVLHLYHHSVDDAVYISAATPQGAGIYKLEAGDVLSYRWRSKPFFTSTLAAMGAVRVEGGQRGGTSIAVSVFGPDAARPRATLRVTDCRTKRFRTVRAEKCWSVELQGCAPVYELRLGSSVEGVEYGQ